MKARPIQGAKFLRFRCTDCGNCCTDTLVPVTADDLQRLKGTGKQPEEFVNFCKASEFADRAEGLPFVELNQGPRVMVLKRRWDVDEGKEACYFYKDRRCTAYEHRPITCRNWPFDLTFDDQGRRITRMAINGELPCPYELDGEPMDTKHLAAVWKKDDSQDLRYQRLVDKWNDLYPGGDEASYLEFLMKESG